MCVCGEGSQGRIDGVDYYAYGDNNCNMTGTSSSTDDSTSVTQTYTEKTEIACQNS